MRASILVVAFLIAAGTATRASADEPESPGVALPIASGLLIGAGAFMTYHYAAEARNDNPRCAGIDRHCYWLSASGALVEQGGGALGAFWAWRLGEQGLAHDLVTGAPVKERRSLALTGLLVAGVGVAAIYVGTLYALVHSTSCTPRGIAGQIDYACLAHAEYVSAIVNLASLPPLVVGALMAGYGFGYDSAAQRARANHLVGLRDMRLVPLWSPAGGGLALDARF